MKVETQHKLRKLFGIVPPWFRAACERWSRGRVVRRRLGVQAGSRPFYASPEAALFWALPWATATADEHLERFCREFVKANDTVWDFGGHLGIFAFSAASQVGSGGKVLAVEPDPFLSLLMMRTESERPFLAAPCTILNCAVGRETGFATLEIPERSRAANALSGKSFSTQRGGTRERIEVPVVTAMQLAARFGAPQVVKMDIEGSELDALMGGEEIFTKVRPVMLLEVYDHIRRETTALLHRWGYRLYDAEQEPDSRRELAEAAYNTLAIPR